MLHAMVDMPTAILASNDLMAIGCISRLRELNYRVPDDISVMGIDDIPFAQIIDPPLTTISLPMYELGKVGMECLVKLREGEALDSNGIILPHKLIARKSTGQPNRQATPTMSGMLTYGG